LLRAAVTTNNLAGTAVLKRGCIVLLALFVLVQSVLGAVDPHPSVSPVYQHFVEHFEHQHDAQKSGVMFERMASTESVQDNWQTNHDANEHQCGHVFGIKLISLPVLSLFFSKIPAVMESVEFRTALRAVFLAPHLRPPIIA
jgi:hypothetical protein